MSFLENAKPESLLKYIKSNEVEFVDFKFTDVLGRVHTISMLAKHVDEGTCINGILTDASSVKGWREINNADMVLIPDLTSIYPDPFATEGKTIIIFCSALDPKTKQAYSRDPRTIAKKTMDYVAKLGLSGEVVEKFTAAKFGIEPEFFIFDGVKIENNSHESSYKLISDEVGNIEGFTSNPYKINKKGGYWADAPLDNHKAIRARIVKNIDSMGIGIDKHHHEVGSAQHELCVLSEELCKMADVVQLYKYCVHNTAAEFGKSATFMPKPVLGENGSGMHVHQSLWHNDKPLFDGDKYAGLSDTALYYMGGILKHAHALNAITNPSTNSYKRLVPGYEAPILLSYSAGNRSASFRIPYASTAKAKRVEVRFPDPLANPYLMLASLVLAGVDGIKNKIHPGEAIDKDLYKLPPHELAKIPTVAKSLGDALDALEKDYAFLLVGDVFSEDMIKAYIELKRAELRSIEIAPHPAEFDLYYNF